MPPAVNDSEPAMYAMVRLPVSTRGSRRMAVLLETASMPVNVPPPSENALRNSASTPSLPSSPAAVRVSWSVSATMGPNCPRWVRMP